MQTRLLPQVRSGFHRVFCCCISLNLLFTSLFPVPTFSQNLRLPEPGAMVLPGAPTAPVLIKGLRLHPENPLLFDFMVDTGSGRPDLNSADFRNESQKLIRYFLASLTIPENDLWVNLSPFEKDKMIPSVLGQTELGRDMLAQDYILKQLTASLIYPEQALGRSFWEKLYARARQASGPANIPTDVFNKVWVVADRARILQKDNTAYVLDGHLKVMLDVDYLAETKTKAVAASETSALSLQTMREIIIPAIEQEVNQGEHFAPLRQIFYAMILATWFKHTLKNALLNRIYTDQNKTAGVLTEDPEMTGAIYARYLAAYKQGVFNYIREEEDPDTGAAIPRKYFSGGIPRSMGINAAMQIVTDGTTPRSGCEILTQLRPADTDMDLAQIVQTLTPEGRDEIDRAMLSFLQNHSRNKTPVTVVEEYLPLIQQIRTMNETEINTLFNSTELDQTFGHDNITELLYSLLFGDISRIMDTLREQDKKLNLFIAVKKKLHSQLRGQEARKLWRGILVLFLFATLGNDRTKELIATTRPTKILPNLAKLLMRLTDSTSDTRLQPDLMNIVRKFMQTYNFHLPEFSGNWFTANMAMAKLIREHPGLNPAERILISRHFFLQLTDKPVADTQNSPQNIFTMHFASPTEQLNWARELLTALGNESFTGSETNRLRELQEIAKKVLGPDPRKIAAAMRHLRFDLDRNHTITQEGFAQTFEKGKELFELLQTLNLVRKTGTNTFLPIEIPPNRRNEILWRLTKVSAPDEVTPSILRFLYHYKLALDTDENKQEPAAEQATEPVKGGIDLDGNKLNLSVDQQDGDVRTGFENFRIEGASGPGFTGFMPVILKITPLSTP